MTRWFFTPKLGPLMWRCSFILLIICAVSSAEVSPQRVYLKTFVSRRIQFPNENAEKSFGATVSSGRYPQVLKFLLQRVVSWNPSGEWAKYSEACDPAVWKSRLMDPRINAIQLQGALVQKYFKECASEVETGTTTDFMNTLKILSMQFSTDHHPFLQRVLFQLPGAVNLKGYLALKGDYKKRPFVVLRLGIFSSVEDFLPERYLLMQLFEQSPFNVLVLENMTGPDFIANNERFAFGGYDEGIQNILIAKLLKDPTEPISQIVGSLHFVGVSLGGHGVLFASLLNEMNRSSQNKKLIDSFLGFCPVVNLQPTTEHLSDQGLRSRAVNFWSAQRLVGLRDRLPALEDVSSFYFMPTMMGLLENRYTGGLSYNSTVQFPEGMTDSSNFWKQNDYWPFYKNVQSPVMVWATRNDPVVGFTDNSATLRAPNIRVVPFDEGVHCTLPIAYRWEVISSLVQGYLLSHSENFAVEKKSFTLEASEQNLRHPGRQSFEVIWKNKKEKFVRIKVGDQQVSLPLQDFDFYFRNSELSEVEQRMLERWLQQNLVARIEGRSLVLRWEVAK